MGTILRVFNGAFSMWLFYNGSSRLHSTSTVTIPSSLPSGSTSAILETETPFKIDNNYVHCTSGILTSKPHMDLYYMISDIWYDILYHISYNNHMIYYMIIIICWNGTLNFRITKQHIHACTTQLVLCLCGF